MAGLYSPGAPCTPRCKGFAVQIYTPQWCGRHTLYAAVRPARVGCPGEGSGTRNGTPECDGPISSSRLRTAESALSAAEVGLRSAERYRARPTSPSGPTAITSQPTLHSAADCAPGSRLPRSAAGLALGSRLPRSAADLALGSRLRTPHSRKCSLSGGGGAPISRMIPRTRPTPPSCPDCYYVTADSALSSRLRTPHSRSAPGSRHRTPHSRSARHTAEVHATQPKCTPLSRNAQRTLRLFLNSRRISRNSLLACRP